MLAVARTVDSLSVYRKQQLSRHAKKNGAYATGPEQRVYLRESPDLTALQVATASPQRTRFRYDGWL
jgi:hypothetical protein